MLIIPNASDTTSGNRFEALDQAEPDSLDFEILGNNARSGVFSGCAVTTNNSASTVAVSSGVVVLNGTPYAVGASPALGVPSAPADSRFDVVVARISGSTATLTVVQGVNDATNPSFPKSASVITGAFAPATNIDLSTDVVLAALYRTGTATVTASRIADKRVFKSSSIFNQGTADPLSGSGTGAGDLYFKTTAPNGPESGVWVRRPNGTWTELAQNVGSHLPIGAAVAWPSKAAVPSGCLEANGQALSTSAYPALFAVYGYDHGGSGGTFNVPNWNNKFLRGTTNPAAIATTVGADTFTISTANLPAHTHTMAHTHAYSHTHGMPTHQHSMYHDHSSGSTSTDSHSHTYNRVDQVSNITTSSAGNDYFVPQVTGSFLTSTDSHSHSFDMPAYSGNTTSVDPGDTSSQSSSTTLGSSAASTGPVGSGNSISNIPLSAYTRWIIRASLGNDAAAVGDPSPYEHLFSMSKELASPTAGEKFLWVATHDCTIATVRAYREGGTSMSVNVRIANAADALLTDLSVPAASTWVSAIAGNGAVSEGSLVEIDIAAIAGSPTLAIVQVDFSS